MHASVSAAPFRSAATVALAAALCLAAACGSIGPDRVVESATQADFSTLDDIELLVAEYRLGSDPGRLAEAKRLSGIAASRSSLNQAYTLRLMGLAGEIALLSGDLQTAQAAADRLLKNARTEEYAWLLAAWLTKDPAKARDLLAKGRAEAASSARIQAELAELDMTAGSYRSALALYDQAIPDLSEGWRSYYLPKRDAAYRLRDSSMSDASFHAAAAKITFIGMITIADSMGASLAFLTEGKLLPADAIFDRLVAAHWFDPGTRPSDPARRKDVSGFLWRLYSERKRDPALLTKYSARYSSKPGVASPIPDLSPGSPWFDAALGCVERGLMRLPDGRNFDPEGSVSGPEFFESIKALAKLF